MKTFFGDAGFAAVLESAELADESGTIMARGLGGRPRTAQL